MEPRIDYGTASPKGLAAMLGMERHVHASGLDPKLIESREAARLAHQRLRVLRGHAHEGRPLARRDRAAALRRQRLGRNVIFFRPGARGACVDRGGHHGQRGPCARRSVRAGAAAVQRAGTGRSHADDRDDQRLEPARDRVPNGPGNVSARFCGLTPDERVHRRTVVEGVEPQGSGGAPSAWRSRTRPDLQHTRSGSWSPARVGVRGPR